jgi:osmoprotectant transport system permease protein
VSLLADAWDFYTGNQDLVNQAFWEHVRLTVVALALAAATGIVLGIVCAKVGRVAGYLVVLTGNLGRTVPTFAVMALALTLTSIGFWPAAFALFLLGVPPVLLNTFTGIRNADAGAVEAARGMGFTAPQVLVRVELPGAVPLVLSGVRTAAVEIIATATLAGLVGAGGLGKIMLSGLANGQDDVLLAAAIPLALLALAAQALFALTERLVTPRGLRIARGLAITEGRTT